MIDSSRYTVKVWLTAISITPIILQVINYLSDGTRTSTFGEAIFIYCFITVISFFISVFTWLLFFACTSIAEDEFTTKAF